MNNQANETRTKQRTGRKADISRYKHVLKLYNEGKTYAAIGSELGIRSQSAWALVKRALRWCKETQSKAATDQGAEHGAP